MTSISPFFDREYTCPVCSHQFSSLAVRSSSVYVITKNSDFRVVYKGLDPFYYSIIACPKCCYAASQNVFSNEIDNGCDVLRNALSHLQPAPIPNLCGERDQRQALQALRLAIQSAQLRRVPPGDLAGLLLGAAWISEDLQDQRLESVYRHAALECYLEAFDHASGGIVHMNEAQSCYLIAELYRRIGEYGKAVTWFRNTVGYEDITPQLEKLARDQWALAREESQHSKQNHH